MIRKPPNSLKRSEAKIVRSITRYGVDVEMKKWPTKIPIPAPMKRATTSVSRSDCRSALLKLLGPFPLASIWKRT